MATDTPVIGTKDTSGEDTYTIIVPQRTNGQQYRNFTVRCETNGALISCDGGITDHFEIAAGERLTVYSVTITALAAKNATPGSSYANLTASCW